MSYVLKTKEIKCRVLQRPFLSACYVLLAIIHSEDGFRLKPDEKYSLDGEWPQLAEIHKSFRLPLRQKTMYFHQCGAVLVDADWIITARHCFEDWDPGHYDLSFQISVGSSMKTTVNRGFGIIKTAYIPKNRSEDIALVQLQSSVTISRLVSIAKLPVEVTIDSQSETKCYAVGWKDYSQLRQVESRIVSPNICLGYNKGLARGGDKFSPDKELCIWNKYGNYSTICHGDSGSPLLCKITPNSQWRVMGIVARSAGQHFNCNASITPTIFTRVDVYAGFFQCLLTNSRDNCEKSFPNQRSRWLMLNHTDSFF